MSQAFLRLQPHREPKPLVGCSTLQHTIVSLEIQDPEGRLLAEVEMSSDQFLRLMIGNSNVDVTLARYRGDDGKLAEEVPEMPQTHRENLYERLEEYHKEDSKRTTGIIETLRAMINGHIKPNKNVLNDLLSQMETVASHRASNEAFAVRQAEEEVNAIENDLRGGLALMLTQITGDDRFEQIAKALMPGDDHRALPSPVNVVDPDTGEEVSSADRFPENSGLTVQENTAIQESGPSYMPVPAGAPAPLAIPQIPIEDMTADDLARAISRILRKMEKDPEINPVSKRHGTSSLFGAGACAQSSKKITITYVSYQGSSKVDLEVAREMLRRLREGKFVRHFEVEREMKGKP